MSNTKEVELIGGAYHGEKRKAPIDPSVAEIRFEERPPPSVLERSNPILPTRPRIARYVHSNGNQYKWAG